MGFQRSFVPAKIFDILSQLKYLTFWATSQFCRGGLLFPYLPGSGYSQRRQIKSHNLHLLSHKSYLKMHANDERKLIFEASSLNRRKSEILLRPNCLATKMKGSSLGCFRVLCAAWLTEKINKSYIDSALKASQELMELSRANISPFTNINTWQNWAVLCFALIFILCMWHSNFSRQLKLWLHKSCKL